MNDAKINRHIEHLREQHTKLEKELTQALSNFESQIKIADLKKRKLQIKDEIERLSK